MENEGACKVLPRAYNFDAAAHELQDEGFEPIGQGGFGVIMARDACVVKLIKDVDRCDELDTERRVHQCMDVPSHYGARVPQFEVIGHHNDYCHFNMERLLSPVSTWGDIYEDDEDYGHGVVLRENKRGFEVVDGGVEWRRKVDPIERPGRLVHLYVNHYDPDLHVQLDNGQGVLMGPRALEQLLFNHHEVARLTYDVGQLLAYLIFECHVIPSDVEVVLATTHTDRVARAYIYDFNECSFWRHWSPAVAERVARAMYAKNGKHYFPTADNPYWIPFARGFRSGPIDQVSEVLSAYNRL